MKTKLFFIFTAFCLLALTGCSNGRVGSMASQAGEDVSNAISKVESALDGMDNSSSGFPTESQQSSMPDYSSSQGGGINSGDDNITNGTESDSGSGLDGYTPSGIESSLNNDDSEANGVSESSRSSDSSRDM